MVIDVSGDTESAIANVGLAPVFAVQQSANEVLVVNHSVATSNTGDSLSALFFSGASISANDTIALPANSGPNFVATAPSSTTVYVTLPNLNAVGVVKLSESQVATVPVGSNPDALAVTPNNNKLYVANLGSNSISAFNTLDLSPRTINGSVTAPVWLSARSDSQRVYVLGNGVVSTIDTTSTAGPDAVIDASISVPGATDMLYDANLNRIYIPNGSQLTMLDVSQSIPVVITGNPIAIAMAPASSRSAGDPCLNNAPQTPLTVAAVTVLPDESRLYVGAYYDDSGSNVCPQVTVIDLASSTVKTVTPVPGFPDATIQGGSYMGQYYVPVCASTRFRFMMAAGGDSSRTYLSSCDGGTVDVIDTASDTYILNLAAPIGVRPPISPNPLNPSQNPVFLLAGP
jgi:DNA-binding beta-propeller fold protein YncE